jgi:hypothetical protein
LAPGPDIVVIIADNHEDDITTYAATGVRMRM